MAPQQETELFWHAFRYVGQEMTTAESADFERQLGKDQSAREAVARVVELTQLCLAAAPEWAPAADPVLPAVRTQAAWMQPVGWAAVGAAACLALVMAFQTFAPAPGTMQAFASPGSAGELAQAWVIARTDLPASSADTTTDAALPAGAVAAIDDLPGGTSIEFVEPEAPGWLLVAVEDARGDQAQEN